MSQLRVAPEQVGTAAEDIIKIVQKSGMSMIVASDLSPRDLFTELTAKSPRLAESVILRRMFSLDISVMVVHWAILASPKGSVAAFVPVSFDRGGYGARGYATHIIDPVMALGNRPGTLASTYSPEESQPELIDALNASSEIDPVSLR